MWAGTSTPASELVPPEAERYDELKLSLFGRHPNDRVAYTEGKAEYIKLITERAKWRYGAT